MFVVAGDNDGGGEIFLGRWKSMELAILHTDRKSRRTYFMGFRLADDCNLRKEAC